MSTELATVTDDNNDSVTVTRFSGGVERGVCVQVNHADWNTRGVQMTVSQAREVARVLTEFVNDATASDRMWENT